MSVVFFIRTSRILVPAHTTLIALVCSNSTPFRASIASLTTATAAAGRDNTTLTTSERLPISPPAFTRQSPKSTPRTQRRSKPPCPVNHKLRENPARVAAQRKHQVPNNTKQHQHIVRQQQAANGRASRPLGVEPSYCSDDKQRRPASRLCALVEMCTADVIQASCAFPSWLTRHCVFGFSRLAHNFST